MDLSPIDVFQKLPGLNCAECGEKTCMAFASKLIEREKRMEDCPPIAEDPEEYRDLKELLTPPVRPVGIGSGDGSRTIGGEEVVYRHEKTYFNPTAIVVDVDDEMDEGDLEERVSAVDDYVEVRIGKELTLDGVAIRCKSGDPDSFGEAVGAAEKNTDLPLVLCTLDPEAMEAGLEAMSDVNPLMYGATTENAEEMIPLADKYGSPLVVVSDDLDDLRNLSQNAIENGLGEQVVLDPVMDPYHPEGVVNRALQIRRAAMDGREFFRYPILTTPLSVYAKEGGDDAAYWEGTLAATMMNRWSDAVVVHSMEPWTLLPLVTLRQNIYQDPREPANVEAGLREMGDPDENSPVLLTTNFALTYYTVESDIKGSADAWLLVADTEGLAVDVSIAGDKLNETIVDDLIEDTGIENRVDHRDLILPGKAGKLSGRIEIETGWNVEVGPEDSSGIPEYLDEREKAAAEA